MVAPSRRSPYGSPEESGFPKLPEAPDPSIEEYEPPIYAADPQRSNARDETSELAKGLLKELTESSVKNAVQAIAALFGDPPAAAMSIAIQTRKRIASQASKRRKL